MHSSHSLTNPMSSIGQQGMSFGSYPTNLPLNPHYKKDVVLNPVWWEAVMNNANNIELEKGPRVSHSHLLLSKLSFENLCLSFHFLFSWHYLWACVLWFTSEKLQVAAWSHLTSQCRAGGCARLWLVIMS